MAVPVRRGNGNAHATETEVSRWDPFGELGRLTRQLSSYLDSWPLPSFDTAFTPLADLEETDDAYVVELELPGVKKDDLDIEIAGRRVTVSGERKEKERVGILRRRERVVGRFRYEVTLPGEVEENGVEAHLDEGVLAISVPKPASARPRRIEIR